MAVIANMKQDDLLPPLEVQLLDGPEDSGSPVPLTGATVRFHMKNIVVGIKVNSGMTIVDAAQGLVRYDWVDGDTDTAGKFNAEVEVTFSDGKTQTFPASKYFTVVIDPQLA